MTETLPHWDLSNVYPGLTSAEFLADFEKLKADIVEFERFFAAEITRVGSGNDLQKLADALGCSVDWLNRVQLRAGTLRAYIDSFVSTDSRNTTASKALSAYEQANVKFEQVTTRFKRWVGSVAPSLEATIQLNAAAQAHAFMLRETAEQARYLMSPPEEALAAELTLSGANAWSKLQRTLTSQLTVEFELDGKLQALPMPALVNLRSHPTEEVRRRAHEAEIQACKSVREALAACLNGVTGEVALLNQRRGRTDALHSAIDMARIDRPTLEAMLEAMEASFPRFRQYFQAKALRLGKLQLAWWDLFAPTGRTDMTFSFAATRDIIVEYFGHFSPDLSAFAQRAFESGWIDAEPRSGKEGGAFCMEVPGVKESRILTSFDGSLDQLSTIAHELGHAFHNECAFAANKTMLQMNTPMTLAETASILCETIVMEGVRSQTTDPKQELAILEISLINSSQVIVDIYSRFLFEREVFERRMQGELSADEFCALMAQAQQAAYADGLDAQYLHPYMWTWKGHYYSPSLSFYNFPYAFGLLFATGLYAIYQQRGADFVPAYKDLLASTGEATAAELAARFGIDIRSRKFWEDSLGIIGVQIDRYCAL